MTEPLSLFAQYVHLSLNALEDAKVLESESNNASAGRAIAAAQVYATLAQAEGAIKTAQLVTAALAATMTAGQAHQLASAVDVLTDPQ